METVTPMSALLTNIGLVVSEAASWAGNVASTVVDTPIYLVFTAIPVVGLGIGLFKRLTR